MDQNLNGGENCISKVLALVVSKIRESFIVTAEIFRALQIKWARNNKVAWHFYASRSNALNLNPTTKDFTKSPHLNKSRDRNFAAVRNNWRRNFYQNIAILSANWREEIAPVCLSWLTSINSQEPASYVRFFPAQSLRVHRMQMNLDNCSFSTQINLAKYIERTWTFNIFTSVVSIIVKFLQSRGTSAQMRKTFSVY